MNQDQIATAIWQFK